MEKRGFRINGSSLFGRLFRGCCAGGARVAALAALLLAGGCAGPRVGRVVDARVPRRHDAVITNVVTAGPFFEKVETSDGDSRVSVRPLLYTKVAAPQELAAIREVLWPVYADHGRGDRFAWRLLVFFGADFDVNDPQSRYYAWFFPLWFQGRSKHGEDYAALFPLAGVLRDFLTYDRIGFFGFPLWMKSEKRGITSKHVLWPVFMRAEGEGLYRWRVFPLVGYGKRDGYWERNFALWPIWNYARYDRGATAGYEWALVPIYGRAERGVESSWYVLPPFFQVTRGRGRNEGQRRILAPWPIVRIEDSKDRHKRVFWPLYGTSWTENTRNTYVLWPFFRYTMLNSGGETTRHWSFAPLFHHSTQEGRPRADAADVDGEPVRYTRLWPLYSKLGQDGKEFVRIPDLSFQRRAGALERNLLHMATLYTCGRDEADERVERDLLWGMFRWGRDRRGLREAGLWPLVRWRREPGNPERAKLSLFCGILRFSVSYQPNDISHTGDLR